MADAEYRDVVEAKTAEDLTRLSISFALQQLPVRFMMLSSSPLGQESTEKSIAQKNWLANHEHACVRLVAHWSKGSKKASQEWLLTSPLTAKRMLKLERAGLASAVVVDIGSAEDVLKAIQARAHSGWKFEGVEYPPDLWIRGLIKQANHRTRRGPLASVLSARDQRQTLATRNLVSGS